MKKITFLLVVLIAAFAVIACGDDDKNTEAKPECVVSDDCDEGQECKDGSCVDKEPEVKPECVTSADCTDGKECQNGFCVTVTPEEYCGDGIVNGEEACDEGTEANDGHYGGCNEDCTLAAFCGDGVQDEGEACDKGTEANVGGYNGCKADCTLDEYCGDGVKNGAEECDDGTENGTYGKCNALCTGVGDYCGDGVQNGEEACDDGANNGLYGYCKTDCSGLGERCGDAIIQKAVCPVVESEEESDADADAEASDAEVSDAEASDAETSDTEASDAEVTDAEVSDAEISDTEASDAEISDTDAPETPAEPAEDCVVNEKANENCDEGEFNGVYGHCNAECTGFYGCGDGIIQRENCDGYGENCVVTEGINEECDYGINNGTEFCKYGQEEEEGVTCKRCTAECKLSEEDATLSYCGDLVVVELDGETCDEGKEFNGKTYGQCNAECTSLMICGDGVIQRESCTGYDNCVELEDANATEICDKNTKSCNEIAAVFSVESEAKCSECSSWDESTCECAEHYSGNDCLTCDGSFFCNGHGTCTSDRNGKVTCECKDHFTGAKCNECEDKYHLNDAGTECIKDCDNSCGVVGILNLNPASHGHCDYSQTYSEDGFCLCDPCYKTTGLALIAPNYVTPQCAEYIPGCQP